MRIENIKDNNVYYYVEKSLDDFLIKEILVLNLVGFNIDIIHGTYDHNCVFGKFEVLSITSDAPWIINYYNNLNKKLFLKRIYLHRLFAKKQYAENYILKKQKLNLIKDVLE